MLFFYKTPNFDYFYRSYEKRRYVSSGLNVCTFVCMYVCVYVCLYI